MTGSDLELSDDEDLRTSINKMKVVRMMNGQVTFNQNDVDSDNDEYASHEVNEQAHGSKVPDLNATKASEKVTHVFLNAYI